MSDTGTGKTGNGFNEQAASPYQADVTPTTSGPTVTLAPDHQRWVDQAVADGLFDTADDAVKFAFDRFLPPNDVAVDQTSPAFTREDYVRSAGPYADLVGELIASGAFEHPADVILEGLALLEQQELIRKAIDDKLKAAIEVGIDQADRGELRPAEEVFARLRTRVKAKA